MAKIIQKFPLTKGNNVITKQKLIYKEKTHSLLKLKVKTHALLSRPNKLQIQFTFFYRHKTAVKPPPLNFRSNSPSSTVIKPPLNRRQTADQNIMPPPLTRSKSPLINTNNQQNVIEDNMNITDSESDGDDIPEITDITGTAPENTEISSKKLYLIIFNYFYK